jgi:lysozyme
LSRLLAAAALLTATALLGEAPTAEAQQITTRAAAFDDADPVEFGPKGPRRYPVHGIDAARWQGEIDWKRAARNGVNFAFLKATEGGDMLDPSFRDNWRGAKRAGVLRGAYHFYYFCTPAKTQARWFIRNVPKEAGALPPVLDMEWNHLSPTCKTRPPAREVRAQMTTFLDMVERHYGQRPIIYTTPAFYDDNDLDRMTGEEFWLRSVAKTLDRVYPGQAWAFWQYSGTGRIGGIEGNVDLNAFAGSRQAWSAWVARRGIK